MEMSCRNCFSIGLLLLVLLFSASLLPHSDARKTTMLQPKGSNLLVKNLKRLKISKHYLSMDDVSIMDSSNSQPYVSSPFSWPPFDSLPPENSPPYCIYPPTTPSTSPTPTGPSPTPTEPGPLTPTLPSPVSPTVPVPVPSPPDSGISPSPPDTGISPSPPDTGLIPSPPDTGTSPSPPDTGINPSPPDTGLIPSPPDSGISPSPPDTGISRSPPSYEPSPPGNLPSPPSYTPFPPSPTIFVPSPPVFQPPVVYPPPAGPPPHSGAVWALWCVVKPSVPDPIIQEAMNYACASGADCGPIQPSGLCFQPNNLLAHASYAFNSYWQRTKVAGGSCSFGGTAILVTVDPSHEGCHFDYA